MRLIKPKPLSQGDMIGIIAPSFFIEKRSEFKLGIKNLEEMGYKIKKLHWSYQCNFYG